MTASLAQPSRTSWLFKFMFFLPLPCRSAEQLSPLPLRPRSWGFHGRLPMPSLPQERAPAFSLATKQAPQTPFLALMNHVSPADGREQSPSRALALPLNVSAGPERMRMPGRAVPGGSSAQGEEKLHPKAFDTSWCWICRCDTSVPFICFGGVASSCTPSQFFPAPALLHPTDFTCSSRQVMSTGNTSGFSWNVTKIGTFLEFCV